MELLTDELDGFYKALE
ncbi:hypothetical protein [Maribacter antarcticus]